MAISPVQTLTAYTVLSESEREISSYYWRFGVMEYRMHGHDKTELESEDGARRGTRGEGEELEEKGRSCKTGPRSLHTSLIGFILYIASGIYSILSLSFQSWFPFPLKVAKAAAVFYLTIYTSPTAWKCTPAHSPIM